MADASHSDLIAQFTGVTGTNAERAKFYLESAAWNLEVWCISVLNLFCVA